MEPFSLELWLKAVIQEQQGPNTPIESKEDDHPHIHHLSNLWKEIENPLKTLIEKTHEQLRGQVDAITELLLMRQAFPAREWTHEDVMLIKAPDMEAVCEHYNNEFAKFRYGDFLTQPDFAESKKTAIAERGFEIGLRCARSAMREVLLKKEGVKETERDIIITNPETFTFREK